MFSIVHVCVLFWETGPFVPNFLFKPNTICGTKRKEKKTHTQITKNRKKADKSVQGAKLGTNVIPPKILNSF